MVRSDTNITTATTLAIEIVSQVFSYLGNVRIMKYVIYLRLLISVDLTMGIDYYRNVCFCTNLHCHLSLTVLYIHIYTH